MENQVRHEPPTKEHHICHHICPKCEIFYTGQTKNLRNRVTVHKGQLKHEKYRHLYVSEHLNLCNAGNFKICPLYNCYNNTRLSKESREKET